VDWIVVVEVVKYGWLVVVVKVVEDVQADVVSVGVCVVSCSVDVSEVD